MLGAFYWVIDVQGWKRWWAFPLLVVGANSIAMYMMAETLHRFIAGTLETHLDLPAQTLLGHGLFEGKYGPIVESVTILLILWLACYWLWRRQISSRSDREATRLARSIAPRFSWAFPLCAEFRRLIRPNATHSPRARRQRILTVWNLLLIHQAFWPDQAGGTRHFELASRLIEEGDGVAIVASDLSYLTGQKTTGSGTGLVTREEIGRDPRSASFLSHAPQGLRVACCLVLHVHDVPAFGPVGGPASPTW